MGKSANIKEYFQNISDELNDLCNIHASAEYSFDSLEKQISSMIKTAQVNDDFDDIDDEKWQSSQNNLLILMVIIKKIELIVFGVSYSKQ